MRPCAQMTTWRKKHNKKSWKKKIQAQKMLPSARFYTVSPHVKTLLTSSDCPQLSLFRHAQNQSAKQVQNVFPCRMCSLIECVLVCRRSSEVHFFSKAYSLSINFFSKHTHTHTHTHTHVYIHLPTYFPLVQKKKHNPCRRCAPVRK